MPAMSNKYLLSNDSTLEQKIFNALTAYFLKENYKLGIGIKEQHIIHICKILLYGNEADSDLYIWQVSENTLLDEYRREELEIMDYLHLVSFDLRKQLGQYSTPVSIVRRILESVEYTPSKDILHKRLLDPACGSGVFLVESAHAYLNVLKKARIPLYKWYPMVIAAISGIDIDPKACLFARLNLSFLLAPSILWFVARDGIENLKHLPVYCADTLQLLVSEKKPLLYGSKNLPLKWHFDFVVGNPPYFKIKNIAEDIKDTFAETIYGHPNAYGLFIQAGIEMLKTHGRLGFIVPRSMLSGLYFKNLRNFIERETSVKEIVYISERKKVFDDVLHGTMILSLKRAKEHEEKTNISFVRSLKDIRNQYKIINIKRDKVIQRLNGTTVWFVADSVKAYNIINRIIKEHPLLSGNKINCKAKTGQIVWNRVKPLLTETAESNTLPLVWATDVGKFSFSFNRARQTRPCFLEVNQKTENLVVKDPAILIQRITADEQPYRIVASIPAEFCKKAHNGYFVENHLNIIQHLVNNSASDLYFLLGILNSEITDFFFRTMNGNTQVSVTELNLLPIPIGRYDHAIAEVAKNIQKTVIGSKKDRLLPELNFLVAKAYGLSNKELKFIKSYIKEDKT